MNKFLKTIALSFVCSAAFAQSSVPYNETFESFTSYTKPANGWQTTLVGFQIYPTHGTGGSKGLIKGLNNFALKDSVTSPSIGVVPANSWLKFDYRIVESSLYPSTATVIGSGDQIRVSISANGGAFSNVFTIDQSNHVTSTNFVTDSVSLAAFTGDSIKIQFAAIRGSSGDYFVDLDNIQVTGASIPSAINESIEKVGFGLYPNPTNGKFILDFGSYKGNTEVAIYNMAGQLVYMQQADINNGKLAIEDQNITNGLYLIHVRINGVLKTKKLLFNK